MDLRRLSQDGPQTDSQVLITDELQTEGKKVVRAVFCVKAEPNWVDLTLRDMGDTLNYANFVLDNGST